MRKPVFVVWAKGQERFRFRAAGPTQPAGSGQPFVKSPARARVLLTVCLLSFALGSSGCRERAGQSEPTNRAMPDIEACLRADDLANGTASAIFQIERDIGEDGRDLADFAAVVESAHRPADILASVRAELATVDRDLLVTARTWCAGSLGRRFSSALACRDSPDRDRVAWWASDEVSESRRRRIRELVAAGRLGDLHVWNRFLLLRNHTAAYFITSDDHLIRRTNGLHRKLQALAYRWRADEVGEVALRPEDQARARAWGEATIGSCFHDVADDELAAMGAFWQSEDGRAIRAVWDRVLERAMDDALDRLQATIPDQPYVGAPNAHADP